MNKPNQTSETNTGNTVVQNSTRELLLHMFEVPEKFAVDVKYLNGLSEAEFCEGFRALWQTMVNIYSDVVADPAPYSFPLYEDYDRYQAPADGKWNEAYDANGRIANLLRKFCVAGELNGGVLHIKLAKYNELLKTNPKMSGVQAATLINRLQDFGFAFSDFDGKAFAKGIDTFEISFEDNINLIPALKSYCAIDSDEFKCFQYHIFSDANLEIIPARAFAFSRYLSGQEREFFLQFHKHMQNAGLICKENWTFGSDFGVEYVTEKMLADKTKPWLVRTSSKGGKLGVVIKMFHIAMYNEYLDTLPARFKDAYKPTAPCGTYCNRHLEDCGSKYTYLLDGEIYGAHLYFGMGAEIRDFNPDDAEIYVSLIKMEGETKRNKEFNEKREILNAKFIDKARVAKAEYILGKIDADVLETVQKGYKESDTTDEKVAKLDAAKTTAEERLGAKHHVVATFGSGMENGDAGAAKGELVTLLLIMLRETDFPKTDFNAMVDAKTKSAYTFDFEIKPRDGGATQKVTMSPVSSSEGYMLMRFEPVKAGFVPLKNIKYDIMLDISEKSTGKRWRIVSYDSYMLKHDAIVG